MSNLFEEFVAHVKEHLPDSAKVAFDITGGDLVITLKPEYLIRTLFFLRDGGGCQFKQLIDECGLDYPEDAKRFEVVYNLLSLKFNRRMRIKTRVSEFDTIPSATEVYSSANWFEREIFDMYGVQFTNHPDLRRILTDYGFEGHPQRKDFPLTGYKEVHYCEEEKRVVYAPVSLPQEFRQFDFMRPWEGTDYVLPGDEKATN